MTERGVRVHSHGDLIDDYRHLCFEIYLVGFVGHI